MVQCDRCPHRELRDPQRLAHSRSARCRRGGRVPASSPASCAVRQGRGATPPGPPRPGAPRPLLAECAPAGPATAQPLPRRPPRCSCLEDPGDRRACGLRSIGPHSRIRLSDSALTSLSAETPCKGVQRLER
ncbi:uncharacterized protein LOC121816730 isoform X2 [Ovis aries]|uniref:uncharacterized protein LOC121816730 isoform X2 n=1 Tax=Ovis aries TaxID=9940 RepID=UPI0029529167|nr:uncharacterized protein LOC121816730 isoform X2 [Ovis aries]